MAKHDTNAHTNTYFTAKISPVKLPRRLTEATRKTITKPGEMGWRQGKGNLIFRAAVLFNMSSIK